MSKSKKKKKKAEELPIVVEELGVEDAALDEQSADSVPEIDERDMRTLAPVHAWRLGLVLFLVLISNVLITVCLVKIHHLEKEQRVSSEILKGFVVNINDDYYDPECVKSEELTSSMMDDAIDLEEMFPGENGWTKSISVDNSDAATYAHMYRYLPGNQDKYQSVDIFSGDRYGNGASVKIYMSWPDEKDQNKENYRSGYINANEALEYEDKFVLMMYDEWYFFVSEKQYKLLVDIATSFS